MKSRDAAEEQRGRRSGTDDDDHHGDRERKLDVGRGGEAGLAGRSGAGAWQTEPRRSFAWFRAGDDVPASSRTRRRDVAQGTIQRVARPFAAGRAGDGWRRGEGPAGVRDSATGGRRARRGRAADRMCAVDSCAPGGGRTGRQQFVIGGIMWLLGRPPSPTFVSFPTPAIDVEPRLRRAGSGQFGKGLRFAKRNGR